MDERELREIFLERLHVELHLFRDSMMQKSKADIYAFSYKIEVHVNLYEILVVQAELMPELLLRKLVYKPSGILDAFYQEWISRDDNFFMELRDYVEDELKVLSAGRKDRGKEDEYGEKHHKAT